MFGNIKAVREILKIKNSQIKEERKKYEAEKAANVILSAYIAFLVSKHGKVRIPKKEISEALYKYFVSVSASGGDYVIEVGELPEGTRGKGAICGQTRKI